jgi:hypothetical protein
MYLQGTEQLLTQLAAFILVTDKFCGVPVLFIGGTEDVFRDRNPVPFLCTKQCY